MTSTSFMQRKQFLFWMFCLTLMVVSVVLVTKNWKGNSYYIHPYQTVDANAREKHRGQYRSNHPRSSPSGQGMRESDIKKAHGDRYSSY